MAEKKLPFKKLEGYTVVVSPSGAESTVPDEIRDILIDSGYTEKK